MSTNLMWKPKATSHGSFSKELKRVISRRLWDTDGSCGGGIVTVNETDIEYIRGLSDAGILDACELVELIEKHGEIELWHE